MDMSHILRPTGLVWIFGQSHLLDLGTSMFWTAGMITEYRVESASRSNVRNRLYPKVRTGSASQNQRRRWSDGRDGRGRFLFNFFFLVFSRMRSKGSLFTLGVWGLRVCSLDVAFVVATVRNRPQPSATVRNRSCEDHGRAYVKFCRGGPFWRFQTSGCFVSRGRRGTS